MNEHLTTLSEPEWRRGASDLGLTIARSTRPVTFLLGAGASLSSGSPPTARVTEALRNATLGRFSGADPKPFLDVVVERDKQDMLAPLFENISPYIGYRCVAALGKHRRLRILNLNWDDALEQACRDLEVPFTAFDLRDATARRRIADTDGPGVDIVHVHGRIGLQCRFETLKTLEFTPSEKKFLRSHFLSNTLVVAGASVINDTDLQALFLEERERASSPRESGLWYFGRHDEGPLADAIRRAQLSRGPLNYFVADDVDFDELMVRLLGPALNADWDRVRGHHPSIALPKLDQLIWPRPALLRPLLGQRTIALVGQARLGKTVLAHFLAYLDALWHADAPWASDLPVRAVDGPSDAVAALAGLIDGEIRSYVVENPFGIGRPDGNAPFVHALAKLETLVDRRSTVVIASRLSAWQGASASVERHTVRSASSPFEWYSPESLRSYVRKVAPGRGDVIDQIGPHGICTPARLQDALAGVPFSSGSSSGDEAEVTDKVTLLEGDERLAWLCCLLRLQEFCEELLVREDIDVLLGEPLEAVPLREVVSHRFDYEGSDRWRLLHDTDREAADEYMLSHEADIFERIPEDSAVGSRLRQAFIEWKLIAAALAGRWDAVRQMPETALRARAPDLVRIPRIDEPTVERLSQLRYDAWEIKDLSYELVRVWSILGETKAGSQLLNRILSDAAASGIYAILEACLYMQSSVSDELWRKVYSSLDDAVRDPNQTKQLALAVDALTWRPPPEPNRQPSWARKFIGRLDPAEPSWALVRFLAGYHGGGMGLLDMANMVERDSTHGWSSAEAQFASWLVRWHFIHQSRARAQFVRQPWVDKDFLCRSLHPEPKDANHSGVNRLLRSFLDHPEEAGWGFFLGCNLAAIGHKLDPEGERLTLQNLRAARPVSQGVIAAALTYMTASRYAANLRTYFASDDNRDALLDAMRDGLLVDGVRLRPPRFVVNRDAASCYADTGLDWSNLKTALASEPAIMPLGRLDVRSLLAVLKVRVEDMPPTQRPLGLRVVEIAETGDLRLLDAAAAARPPVDPAAAAGRDALAGLLNRAATLLSVEQSILL